MSETATFTRISQAYLDALAVRDFDRIEKLLHRSCYGYRSAGLWGAVTYLLGVKVVKRASE